MSYQSHRELLRHRWVKWKGEEAAAFALRGALGRLGEPEEIAKMMAFMVSDACSYLTGVDILYDGGTIAAVQEMMSQQA